MQEKLENKISYGPNTESKKDVTIGLITKPTETSKFKLWSTFFLSNYMYVIELKFDVQYT